MSRANDLADLLSSPPQAVYLVRGDRVLAEPLAEELARGLAARRGCEVEVVRRPDGIGAILADLRTFSLFSSAKVTLVVESAVLADRGSAAELLAEAAEAAAGVVAGEALAPRERSAALRLLQALRLFGLDPFAGPPEGVIEALPEAAWSPGRGRGRGGRGKSGAGGAEGRAALAALLAGARAEGLVGHGESDLAELALVLQEGLPDGHHLVLAESAAAADHPLVRALGERGVLLDAGRVEAERGGGWTGVERLAETLAAETGAEIEGAALAELARRTLRTGGRGQTTTHDDSTSRFAAEYRKLAALAGGGRIGRRAVEEAVEDRGEQDVWQVLDAIGAGRPGEALERLERLLAGAEEPEAARLSFFALLAGLCRQLTALSGLAARRGVPPADRDYARFKSRWAPLLQADEEGLAANPLAGLHPFRLHRAYLLAARLPRELLEELPWRVLETERRLKGESGDAATALADLVLTLSPR